MKYICTGKAIKKFQIEFHCLDNITDIGCVPLFIKVTRYVATTIEITTTIEIIISIVVENEFQT